MKKYTIIILIILTFSFVESQSPKKATFINKAGDVMDTEDGGRTWHNRNKALHTFFIDRSIKAPALQSVTEYSTTSATLIKNGTHNTEDGGITWSVPSTEDSRLYSVSGEIMLYPNPATLDYVCIALPGQAGCKKASATVYDMKGVVVLNENLELKSGDNGSFRLNVSGLQNGVYVLRIVTVPMQYLSRLTVLR